MALTNMDNETKVIKDLIKQEMAGLKRLGVYTVTGIESENVNTGLISNYKASIKHINYTLQYDNVPMVGMGLGNLKGVLKYPNVGDLVLVGFLDDQSSPIILGTLFDSFTQSKDTAPQIRLNELFLNNQEAGAYVYLNKDNEIIITTGNSSTTTFPKLKMYKDGSFKLFNKDGYGIEVSSSGAMTLRGVTINHTQTPGTF